MTAALALALLLAAADGGTDAPTLEAKAGELNVNLCDVDGQTMACMDPEAAITWTRGCRTAEGERDRCLTREEEANGFRFKWASLGAGVGVAVAVLVFSIIVGVGKLQK